LSFIEAQKEPHPAFRAAKVPILPKHQEKYLALRGEAEISLCIERANEYGEQQEKAGKPPNHGALYHAAIEEGWHTGLANKKVAEEAKQALKKAEATAKRQAAEEEKALAERNRAEREDVLGRFRALPEAGQADIIAAFLATDASARAAYKRKGFDSPLFLFPFVQFLKEAK
jgi:ribosomal protein L22